MGPIIELDSSVDLEKLVVDTTKFVSVPFLASFATTEILNLFWGRLFQSVMTFTQAAPPSSDYAIYSRFFGPGLGVPEDPVVSYCVSHFCLSLSFSPLSRSLTFSFFSDRFTSLLSSPILARNFSFQ